MSSTQRATEQNRLSLLVVLAATILALYLPASAGNREEPSTEQPDFQFRSVLPLGTEAIVLQPADRVLFLLGTLECPEMDGVLRYKKPYREGFRRRLVDADGDAVTYFPQDVTFRVTASGRNELLDLQALPVEESVEDFDQYLLKLKFRIKVFRGLKTRYIEPRAVEMIGVPAEVPHDERVYRVRFQLRDIPVEDRVVLEVLAPGGHRLTRFFFELL